MAHHLLRADIQPGQRHGHLVIVRHVPRADALAEGRSSGYWLLLCDCGKECRRQANQIGMSNRLSCGCQSNASGKRSQNGGGRGQRLDVTGMRFGILTATSRIRGIPGQGSLWAFKCDCLVETEARLKDVRNGNTSSCGCLRARTAKNDDVLDINRPWRAEEHVDDRWLVLVGERSPIGAGTTATQAVAPPS